MDIFNTTDASKPVGGMAALRKLAATSAAKSTDAGPWSKFWDARKTFPFRLKPGESTTLIFLTDIKIMLAHDLMFKWTNVPGNSYPNTDYVRAPGYDDEGNPTGEPDVIALVKGYPPKIIGVATVLTAQPTTNKDGEVLSKYTICPLLIKDQTVLNTLELTTSDHNKPLKYAQFRVMRSAKGKKVSNSGDLWTYKDHVNTASLDKFAPDWKERSEAIDLDAGYAVPDRESIIRLLGLHVNIADKNATKKHPAVRYDREAWEKLSGVKKVDKVTTDEDGEIEEDEGSSDPFTVLDELDLDLE